MYWKTYANVASYINNKLALLLACEHVLFILEWFPLPFLARHFAESDAMSMCGDTEIPNDDYEVWFTMVRKVNKNINRKPVPDHC